MYLLTGGDVLLSHLALDCLLLNHGCIVHMNGIYVISVYTQSNVEFSLNQFPAQCAMYYITYWYISSIIDLAPQV